MEKPYPKGIPCKTNFSQWSKDLVDPRRIKSVKFPFTYLVLASVMAIQSGCKSLLNIHKFSCRHFEEICFALQIPKFNHPPCYNVFRNAFLKKDLKIFEEHFNKLFPFEKFELLHLDGKASKGTVCNSFNSKQDFLMTFSAYSSRLSQTVKRSSFHNKSISEIHVGYEFISKFKKRVTITTDALHCNKRFVSLLEEGNHEYFLQFKGHQARLKQAALLKEKTEKPLSEELSHEINHGREEFRLTKTYNFKSNVWPKAATLIIQERIRDDKSSKSFYLSSLQLKASRAAEIARSHWSVEIMHREKDVLMGEDSNSTKNHNLAGVLSVLRSIALNVIKSSPVKSFTAFQQKFAHNIASLFAFF
jgi:predicted transposase YbfD/YdcC